MPHDAIQCAAVWMGRPRGGWGGAEWVGYLCTSSVRVVVSGWVGVGGEEYYCLLTAYSLPLSLWILRSSNSLQRAALYLAAYRLRMTTCYYSYVTFTTHITHTHYSLFTATCYLLPATH